MNGVSSLTTWWPASDGQVAAAAVRSMITWAGDGPICPPQQLGVTEVALPG